MVDFSRQVKLSLSARSCAPHQHDSNHSESFDESTDLRLALLFHPVIHIFVATVVVIGPICFNQASFCLTPSSIRSPSINSHQRLPSKSILRLFSSHYKFIDISNILLLPNKNYLQFIPSSIIQHSRYSNNSFAIVIAKISISEQYLKFPMEKCLGNCNIVAFPVSIIENFF